MLTAPPLPCRPAGPWPLAATLDLGNLPSAVPCARHYTAYILTEWSHLAHLADDARLIVSELVTNAVRHSRGPVTVRLRADSTSLLIDVWDSLPTPPEPGTLAADDGGGRGLGIVAALSRHWGHRLEGCGKTVWALIA
jgi:anti-sigma regulatory factor (Ser/Thr protein kinase)